MDAVYAGSYGKLKSLRSDFLSDQKLSQLMEKEAGDILGFLSETTYRTEIDLLSARYQTPDLEEAVINLHMMNNIKKALSNLPLGARKFMDAYTARWDIENIKVILSSKILGHQMNESESFLTIGDKPIGAIIGSISRDDYLNMIAKADVEEVVNYLAKYKYGVILLEYLEELKGQGDISRVILKLDTYYYSNMLREIGYFNSNKGFRFYSGTKWVMQRFIKDSIDVKNTMAIIKAKAFGYEFEDIKHVLIAGGNINMQRLAETSKKQIEEMAPDMPFKIEQAFTSYKGDPLITYFESALKKALYTKHIEALDSIPISLHTILSFMLRGELERDRVRAIWYTKYYKINKERAQNAMIITL